ncbi:hypothetical protein QVD17_20336 [Tagetes erecta]|uniref:Uncharacterized protein n=1 Tax=Tagetes erecta TaxID=13708 RepID=A0AAD8KL25_TARER|nr:hypothetical protein QVD17_20336 [Tagetes erecta]
MMIQDSIFHLRHRTSLAMETPFVHPKWADEKLQIGVSATSYDDLVSCIINDHHHPILSIIDTEQKNISTDEVNQTDDLQRLTDQDYMEKIMELNDKLDMVKTMVKPGCSFEVLNTALRYMSSLATSLSKTPQRLHASL